MASIMSKVLSIAKLLEHVICNIDNFYDLVDLLPSFAPWESLHQQLPVSSSQIGETALREQVHPLLCPTDIPNFFPYQRKLHCAFGDCPDELPRDPDKPWIEPMIGPNSNDHPGSGVPARPGSTEDEYLVDSKFKLGFTRNDKEDVCTYARGSWRDARVSLVRKPVESSVCVVVPRTICKKNGMKRQFCYREEKKCPEGEVTLGEVVDRLEDVRSRTEGAHFRTWEEPEEYQIGEYASGYLIEMEDERDDDDDDHHVKEA